jgi:hypothetical protein
MEEEEGVIHLHFPSVPISMNHAYESVPTRMKGGKGGKGKLVIVRRLSDAGKSYKSSVKKHLLQTYPHLLTFFQPDVPYVLIVELTFHGREQLYNSTWGDGTKSAAKNRYKELDASNRAKLFEDALAEAVGIDDRHNFFVGVCKTWARDYEATNVWIFNREAEKDNPVDVLIRQLKSAPQAQPHRAVPEL